MGVCTKERKGETTEVLMAATPWFDKDVMFIAKVSLVGRALGWGF